MPAGEVGADWLWRKSLAVRWRRSRPTGGAYHADPHHDRASKDVDAKAWLADNAEKISAFARLESGERIPRLANAPGRARCEGRSHPPRELPWAWTKMFCPVCRQTRFPCRRAAAAAWPNFSSRRPLLFSDGRSAASTPMVGPSPPGPAECDKVLTSGVTFLGRRSS